MAREDVKKAMVALQKVKICPHREPCRDCPGSAKCRLRGKKVHLSECVRCMIK